MAETHYDDQHRQSFLEELKRRAAESRKAHAATITGGHDGEEPLAVWKSHGMQVTHRPDDPQGIARISIGGGHDLPVPLEYCVIRGKVGECIKLLETAIKALRDSPE